jgi:hypothetical protein
MFRSVAALTLTAGLLCHQATLAAPPSYRDSVAAANPVLWYRLNEPAGNVLNQGTLGAGFNAIPTGSIMRGVSSPGGGGDSAFGFAAGTNYLDSSAQSPAVFTGNPTFSIEAVVRLDRLGAGRLWGTFLHWGNEPIGNRTGREVYFGIQNANNRRIYAGFYNAGVRTVQEVPTDTWIHVVWTRAGGNDSETGSTVYINGAPVAIQRDTDLVPGFLTPAQIQITPASFRVNAGRDFPGQRYFTGVLDELALYNRVLTPDEIALRANLALCGADFNGDGFLDFFDYDAFVTAFETGGGLEADFNGDGFVDFFDYDDFVAAFEAGC